MTEPESEKSGSVWNIAVAGCVTLAMFALVTSQAINLATGEITIPSLFIMAVSITVAFLIGTTGLALMENKA